MRQILKHDFHIVGSSVIFREEIRDFQSCFVVSFIRIVVIRLYTNSTKRWIFWKYYIVLQPIPENLQRSNAGYMTYYSTDRTASQLNPKRFYIQRSNIYFTPEVYVIQKSGALCKLTTYRRILATYPREFIYFLTFNNLHSTKGKSD